MSSKKIWMLASAGAIAALWALWAGWTHEENMVPVPEIFSVEHLKQHMDKPEEAKKLFAQYEQLAEAQRRQVRQNKEQAFRQAWEDRLEAYFAADAAERKAILDRHLDDIMAQKEQATKDTAREENSDGDAQKKSGDDKRSYREWTTPQRKAKSEAGSPDHMARSMAYKSALMARARTRGLNLWGSGGGK